MNKRLIIFSGIVVITMVAMFLYYKKKQYTSYLTIVPNDLVSVPKRKRIRVDFRPTMGITVFNIPPAKNVEKINMSEPALDTTNKYVVQPTPAPPNITDAMRCDYLFIYNPNKGNFKILGTTLISSIRPNITSPPLINMRIGPRDSTTNPIYDGTTTQIIGAHEIKFTNLNNYISQRLTIICDNYVELDLVIYAMIGANYYSIRIDKLKNDILILL